MRGMNKTVAAMTPTRTLRYAGDVRELLSDWFAGFLKIQEGFHTHLP